MGSINIIICEEAWMWQIFMFVCQNYWTLKNVLEAHTKSVFLCVCSIQWDNQHDDDELKMRFSTITLTIANANAECKWYEDWRVSYRSFSGQILTKPQNFLIFSGLKMYEKCIWSKRIGVFRPLVDFLIFFSTEYSTIGRENIESTPTSPSILHLLAQSIHRWFRIEIQQDTQSYWISTAFHTQNEHIVDTRLHCTSSVCCVVCLP